MSFPSPKGPSFGRRVLLRLALVQRVFVPLLCLLFLGSSARAADVVEVVITDALGNIRVLTDDKGNILERHDYLPFGEECTTGPCAANPGVGAGQPRKFTGKERDQETGLDYFGARYYGSTIGRFTTVDPVYTWQRQPRRSSAVESGTRTRGTTRIDTGDPDGRVIDTIADIGFILYDVFDIGRSIFRGEGVTGSQYGALGADVLGAVVPFATGGGAALRAAVKADDAARLARNKQAGARIRGARRRTKESEQSGVVQQLTIKTDTGVKTRLDVAGRDVQATCA